MAWFRIIIFSGLLLLPIGCATYARKIQNVRYLFESAQYEPAVLELEELASKKDNELLLYLLELGMVNHASGKYAEAIEKFKEAEKLAVLNDYTSISQEVGSVLFNDSTKEYKGEDFEKILINVYMAIDYTLLGKWDSALVECRRVNQKLDVMISKGKMPYQYNSFAKYLAASLFESQREYNDAFVDYRAVKKWMSEFAYLSGPLMRVADKLKAEEELSGYLKEFPNQRNYRLAQGEGEVILVLEQGRAPFKVPDPAFDLLPMFIKNGSAFERATLRSATSERSADAEVLFDIESNAIRELEGKIALIMAKKVGGIAAKRAMAYGIGQATKSKDAEFMSFLLLLATDHADLRSWVTLPAKLRIARLTLPAGRHDLVLDMVSSGRQMMVKKWGSVIVKAGQISFLNLRVFD